MSKGAIEMKTVLMPTELTSENGGKFLMIGEFKETITVPCQYCDDGCIKGAHPGIDDEECDYCDGGGNVVIPVAVSWSTIKEIYKRAVKHFGDSQK